MISCNHYDYFEIACMHRYPIRLTMKAGEVIEGIAVDMKLNDDRIECIKLSITRSDELTESLVILEHIAEIEALTENPHFTNVSFV